MFDYDRFVAEFKKFRLENKYSQEKYAEILGIPVYTVQKVEAKTVNPTTEVIVSFLNLLGVDFSTYQNSNSSKEMYIQNINQKLEGMTYGHQKFIESIIDLLIAHGDKNEK